MTTQACLRDQNRLTLRHSSCPPPIKGFDQGVCATARPANKRRPVRVPAHSAKAAATIAAPLSIRSIRRPTPRRATMLSSLTASCSAAIDRPTSLPRHSRVCSSKTDKILIGRPSVSSRIENQWPTGYSVPSRLALPDHPIRQPLLTPITCCGGERQRDDEPSLAMRLGDFLEPGLLQPCLRSSRVSVASSRSAGAYARLRRRVDVHRAFLPADTGRQTLTNRVGASAHLSNQRARLTTTGEGWLPMGHRTVPNIGPDQKSAVPTSECSLAGSSLRTINYPRNLDLCVLTERVQPDHFATPVPGEKPISLLVLGPRPVAPLS
jgi:hypothetical protein